MFSLKLDQQTTYTLMALLPLLLQMGALAFAIWADAYFKPKQKRVFLLLLTLVLLLIAQNYLDVLFYKWKTGDLSRTLTGMLGYLLRPIILLLLYYLVEPEGRFRQGWTLVGINTALYLTPLFFRLVFYIDGNSYHGGPLSKTCLIVSLLLLAGLVFLSVRKARQTRGREIWIPIVLVPIILLSIWLDYSVGYSEQPVTFLTIGIVGCCTLYYLWPHLQIAVRLERKQDDTEDDKNDAEGNEEARRAGVSQESRNFVFHDGFVPFFLHFLY